MTTTETLAAFQRRAGGPQAIPYLTSELTILASSEETGGQFALLEFAGTPGAEPPLHVHEREDEMFYILEGEADIYVGDKVISATVGSAVFLPRGIPHTFRVRSPWARALVTMTPGGFDGYFREVSRRFGRVEGPLTQEHREAVGRISAEYGVRFLPAAQAAQV